MSSGASPSPDLLCLLDSPQGLVDALASVRWKKHQDALVELSEHGIVLVVEESGCVQAKVYLKRELFVEYDYKAEGRPRFGLSLGLLVDCLSTFSSAARQSSIVVPIFSCSSMDSPDACVYAEIRTRIPDTVSWDYNFERMESTPLSFTVKEAIDDLEWPGSSIQIHLNPEPPSVILKGKGHGDLQIDFPYYANTDLLIAFSCDHQVSYRYKYKFLHAAVSIIPSSVLKDNRGSKLTIGRGGMLKIQHLVSVRKQGNFHATADSVGMPSRIAYIEFYVKSEEDAGDGQ